jgi:two-component system chemotaxis response regulator CheB
MQALESDPGIEVVGTAANGKIALTKIAQLAPDAVTMDVEMPELNGVDTVRELRKMGQKMPIIMFSTLTERGATATLDALSAGASDYVAKPSNVGSLSESLAIVADQLIPKIRALLPNLSRRNPATGSALSSTGASGSRLAVTPANATAVPRQGSAKTRDDMRKHPIRAIVVGSSTGGPEALSRVISSLQEPLPVPVLVTQHMPPVFTKQLAARLDRLSPNTVVEATDRMTMRPGHIYIAPGDYHMEFKRVGVSHTIILTQGPPVNFCRPSVDVMFRSALESFGSELLTVVLTGMGSDGKAGTGAIVEAGGTAIVQDEETSVVWGMPGATATAGFAHRILPLDEIGPSIWTILSASRAVPGAAGVGGTGGAGSSGPLSGTTRTGIGTAGDKTTKIRGLR